MQDQEKDFAAELKRRIEETEDPAKKRELEGRLARMKADVEGNIDGIPARRSPERQTAAFVPGGGDTPKDPKPNDGAPGFMNNDPRSHPDMEKDWDFDLGEPRVNDGMHDTEQISMGKSRTGPDINPFRKREGVKLAKDEKQDEEDSDAKPKADQPAPKAAPKTAPVKTSAKSQPAEKGAEKK